MLRVTRDNNDGQLTYAQLHPNGGMLLRRQLDSNIHLGGSDYSQVSLDQGGRIQVERCTSETISTMTIEPDNTMIFEIQGKISITLNTDGSLVLNAASSMTVTTGGGINVSAGGPINLSAPVINLN